MVFGDLLAPWRLVALQIATKQSILKIFKVLSEPGGAQLGDLMVFGDLLAPWRLVALQIATKQSILQIFKAISEPGGAQLL